MPAERAKDTNRAVFWPSRYARSIAHSSSITRATQTNRMFRLCVFCGQRQVIRALFRGVRPLCRERQRVRILGAGDADGMASVACSRPGHAAAGPDVAAGRLGRDHAFQTAIEKRSSPAVSDKSNGWRSQSTLAKTVKRFPAPFGDAWSGSGATVGICTVLPELALGGRTPSSPELPRYDAFHEAGGETWMPICTLGLSS